ncbi:hypothetical protein FGB62_45g168 [Gracilaria domingensis]|nr:hypothetical protein FGB62_45g168 [Gracilaria domingensis]
MWDIVEVDKWNSALSNYPAAISVREKDQNKTDLVELEKFVFSELPAIVKSRDQPHITKEEYCKLVKWKLKRGKWRPRLQKFADESEETAVREASTEAFKLLEEKEIKKAIQKLVTLRGCGPATASVILNVADSSLPFMSDELLLAALGQANKYTVKVYLELKDAVQKKMAELSKENSEKEWTAIDIERAVFANHHNVASANGHHKEDPETDGMKTISSVPKKDPKHDEKSIEEDKYAETPEKAKVKSPRVSKKTPSKRKASPEAPKESVELDRKTRPSSIRKSKRTRRQAQ